MRRAKTKQVRQATKTEPTVLPANRVCCKVLVAYERQVCAHDSFDSATCLASVQGVLSTVPER